MNKSELVEAVQKSLGKDATKRCAEDALAAVLDSIATGVKKDGKVQLIGFGTFEVKTPRSPHGPQPQDWRSYANQGLQDRWLQMLLQPQRFPVHNPVSK